MSTKHVSSLPIEKVEGVSEAVIDRQIDLFIALMHADIADPTMLDGVPNRASLALIPDDDPEVADYALQAGWAGVKRGKNVYFLHLTRDADGAITIKWPADMLPPLDRDNQ
ncbi:MAG: hypothetical protein H0W06_10950 [Chloroflexia bacterium]|nr:hypothetical protein [Chloroflexia bacterium]